MKKYIFKTVVFIATAFTFSEARSNGSIPLSACTDMIPNHGVAAQTGWSSYTIDTEYSIFFIPGKLLGVRLYGHSTNFKGFYCQAREVTSNVTVGHFDGVDAMSDVRGHNCFSPGGVYDTISHSLQWSQNTSRETRYLELKYWNASFENWAEIKFRCTFVQSKSVFFVDVESELIRSIKTVTAEKCCEKELVSIGCTPLCRHVSVQPTSFTEAKNLLETNTNSDCNYVQTLKSLRCSYWSQHPSPDSSSEDATESSIRHNLKECCVSKKISQDCPDFCDPDEYAEFKFEGQDIYSCMNKNKELWMCIIYPKEGLSSPESTVETATTSDLTTYPFSFTNSVSIQTTFPTQLEDGLVIYLITTTINVEGALENSSLQQRIFDELKKDVLAPGLETLPGYINVQVGVEVNEGSLVVLSEGRFLQQNDGSVPTLQSVENALLNQLERVGGQISEGNETWFITQSISVQRKDINGLCLGERCEIGQICVEIGADNFVCLCQSQNNEEKMCDYENEIELSHGAITGIALGIAALIIVIMVISILVRCRIEYYHRRDKLKKSQDTNLQSREAREDTSAYNRGYEPDDATENNIENEYDYISSEDRSSVWSSNSNSTAYCRTILNQEQTESGDLEDQDAGYLKPISKKEPYYSVPSDSAKSSQQKNHDTEGYEIMIGNKEDIKLSTEYSQALEVPTNGRGINKNGTPFNREKSISSSELQANGYITFDKQAE